MTAALHAGESELVRVGRDVNRPPVSRRPSLDVSYIALLVAHIPLGLAMKASPGVASIHGLMVVGIVLVAAIMVSTPTVAIYGAIYLACCDVLWRMTGAAVPWEIGKYGLAFVSILVLYRFRRGMPSMFVVWYVVLLLPSAVITALALPADHARDTISFNISGPFALACSVALFSVIRLEPHEFRRIAHLVASPIVAMWAIALQAFLHTDSFRNESSKDAVGGFGPNQVSTMLGFGGMVCILWGLREETKLHKVLFFVVGLALLLQSMLTFSRGGLYNVGAALAIAAVLYIRRPSRIVMAAVALALVALAFLPLLARLDEFTGGALEARFQGTDTTGRDELATADLELWKAEPLTGVGIGQSTIYRLHGIPGAAAHTEFTRILAEHGVLGLLAIGCLGMLAVRNMARRAELWEQAWSLALMVWTASAMANAAMRVAAISLAFGLASLRMAAKKPPAKSAATSPSGRPIELAGPAQSASSRPVFHPGPGIPVVMGRR